MKRALNLILLLTVAFFAFVIWRDSARSPAGAAGAVRWLRGGICARCEGRGEVACAFCDGKGRALQRIQTPCDQCGGSGRYASRVGGQEAPCPFCRGTGRIEAMTDAVCAACGGNGRVPCPACARP